MEPANTRAPLASAPGEPAAELPALAIACLSLAAFGSGVALRVNDALLPRLAQEFTVGLGQAAQVISLFSIAYGLSQLVFGPLGDRYGKYRVIAWATLACGATSLLCALAGGFEWLLFARVLAGATAAAIIPLSMAWIGDVVAYERRQPVLARFLIGQIVGLSAGVWLGGFAADHLSWRTPFFMLAGLFVLISAALWRVNRQLPAHARQMRPAEGSQLRRMIDDFSHILGLPWARVVLLTVFLEGLFLYGPFAFIASHLHGHFGLSLSLAGSLVMLFGLGGFVFALGSTRLVKGLGEVGLARWGGGLLFIALLSLALTPAWWVAAPACLLAGLGFYMLHNTLQLNATQMAPAQRGAAVSAFAFCFFLGQSAGVSIAGLAVERFGSAWVMGLGAAGVLAVAWVFAGRRERRAH
ncbi:MFS transporter [Paucibacter sp. XJ19-41]|uniref:MFS transporter n=1 Tax=Paucibacter sp. XJ19-41 TaxID=2927824 RepID=UPI00234AF496|nr:MFS transporter [Paucibacter sp. XJ19-41]MDC6169273.1 MFS transporter [Paucibacter sp. XJ19-41]